MKFDNIEEFITKFGGVTEEYKFYNDEVTLRYDPKDHIYLLVTPEGLVKQDGVTNVCHIVDKSNVLIPWACKMMGQKLEALIPKNESVNGPDACFISPITIGDFHQLVQQAKTAHKDKLEDAGEVGHAAHGWIESHIKRLIAKDFVEGQLIDIPQEDRRVTSACTAALGWIARHNVRWIHTEKKIYSRDYGYAGTLDGLAHVDSCDDPKCCPVPFKDKVSVVDWKTSNYLYIEFLLQTAAYKKAYEEEFGTPIEDIWIIRLSKEDAELQTWHVPDFMQELGWTAFLDALSLTRSMREIDDALDAIKDEKRAIKKAQELAAKKEAAKLKCKYADKYKGTRKPKCNSGDPCQACLNKYAEVQAQKLLDKS